MTSSTNPDYPVPPLYSLLVNVVEAVLPSDHGVFTPWTGSMIDDTVMRLDTTRPQFSPLPSARLRYARR